MESPLERSVFRSTGRLINRSATQSRWAFALLLLLIAPFSDAVIKAEPKDKPGLIAVHSGLNATNVSGTIGGVFAPFPASLGFELAALGADLGLKSTPAVMTLPDSFSRNPNSTSQLLSSHNQCVYRFTSDVGQDDYAAGVEEGYSSIFGIPFDPVGQEFGDLGLPMIYHAAADVSVRASNAYLSEVGYQRQWARLLRDSGERPDSQPLSEQTLSTLLTRPEFPAGHHQISWEAETTMNTIMDIALPGALLAMTTLGEVGVQRQGATIAAKKGAKAGTAFIKRGDNILKVVGIAEELGLASLDLTSAGEAEQWYKDTSLITARNKGVQTFTVWDTSSPYLIDTNSSAQLAGEQTIELEATDFGGVRLGRVSEQLRSRFRAIDDCGSPFNVTTDSPDSTLLKIDVDNKVKWQAKETSGGPYQTSFALRADQTRDGEQLITNLTQQIVVRDTQAPILVPPAGFARYATEPVLTAGGGFPLGRPLVVDLADPAPVVSNDAPSQLELNRRYYINWQATDDSGNSTAAGPMDPTQFTQVVTLKTPGTNTAPTASGASVTTLTSEPVEILLEGNDTDIIDGVADPLAFEIETFPAHGEFEAPLLPYFIDDYRVTPLGEREEGDEISRVSPLKHLAAEFRLLGEQGRAGFLTARICNAVDGSLDQTTFSGVIPKEFVYRPQTVLVDDEKRTFIRDFVWICEPDPGSSAVNALPFPRISRWTEEGDFVAMRVLKTSEAGLYERWDVENTTPAGDFTVDHNDRLWIPMEAIFSTFGSSLSYYSMTKNFDDVRAHGGAGYNETEVIEGKDVVAVIGDTQFELLYEMHSRGGDSQTGLTLSNELRVRVLDSNDVQLSSEAGYIGRILPGIKGTVLANDIKIDSEGAVYVADATNSLIHKYSATVRNAAGEWVPGDYLGWMGSCAANKTNVSGVFFNACDEDLGVSRGFACTDEKCTRPANPTSLAQGAFNGPESIAIDPRDILYVADKNNQRVQRFGRDGTFAGEARSTGSGVNQGAEPGFILGNMGEPGKVTVNSSSFYVMEREPQNGDFFVHVYKTLPFYDVTDSTAKIKYVSDFDYQGEDSFTYIVDDGIDQSEPALVDVSMSRAFRAPERLRSECFSDQIITVGIPCSLNEDTEIFVRVSAFDKDGFVSTGGLDILDFEFVTPPENGSIEDISATDNALVVRYKPNPDFNGEDRLEFRANDGVKTSDEIGDVAFTVFSVPDPVAIEFEDNLRAARGFPMLLNVDYSDVDKIDEQHGELLNLSWGDGAISEPSGWANSGRLDANQRELTPQLRLGDGRGKIIGTHTYTNAGRFPVSLAIENSPEENLPTSTAVATVEVIQATMLTSTMTTPSTDVDPDQNFPVLIDVTNLLPEGWIGLPALNTIIEIELPEGLSLLPLDFRCSPSIELKLRCVLGTLQPDQTVSLSFTGRIPLEQARESSSFSLKLTVTDAGPKLQDKSLSFGVFDVADDDEDGFFNTEDAFPDDARYVADSDGDGLPDAWERQNGYDPEVANNTSADDDGDGFDLETEFLQQSFPQLAEVPAFSAGVRLQAPIAGRGDDEFSRVFASADFDQDGIADAAIAAPKYDDGDNASAVFISYGDEGDLTQGYVERFSGNGSVGYGNSLAAADFDGNGYPDLAIATQNEVIVHDNNGEILALEDRTLSVGAGPNAARTLLSTGDFDDDGIADLVVVSALGTTTTYVDFHLSGGNGWDDAPQRFTVAGDHQRSVAVGDVDGDGRADLLLGNGSNSVIGLLGSANDWQAINDGDLLTASFELTPDSGQSRFGWSMATGEDINGDNVDDVVVGAYATSNSRGAIAIYDSREAYWLIGGGPNEVINGLDDGSSPGDSRGDQFGVTLALGHLDRDSFAEIVVGANRAGLQDQGQVQIIRGNPVSASSVPPDVINGASALGHFGYFVDVLGDIDGDGVSEIGVGAPSFGQAATGGYLQVLHPSFAAQNPAEDQDGDGVRTAVDNCLDIANTDQADLDGDGQGNDCDADADADGMDGQWEIDNGLDPLFAGDADDDLDGDGLSNQNEFVRGTAANNADSDRDGIDDAEEIARGSDPLFADTDGDGLGNSIELDDDADGLLDTFENSVGLNPVDGEDALADLDGDGFSNLAERAAGTLLGDMSSSPEVPSAPTTLFASVLPGHRATQVGRTVTAFASIINAGDQMANACSLVPLRPTLGRWGFTPTDSATNEPDGESNELRDIEAGATQSYVFEFTPAAVMAEEIAIWFDCENTDAVQVLDGLNTFGITANVDPTVDMVALSATATNDGILRIPGAGGAGAFALASVNVGVAGPISARVEITDSAAAVVGLCETDANTGACLGGSAPQSEVLLNVDADATPTFSVFAQASEDIVLDPARNRVFVRFYDALGAVVGSSSVAITTTSD